MSEYITRKTVFPSHGMPMNGQILLKSFKLLVGKALSQSLEYDKIMNIGSWQLIFSAPRREGLLPVIMHALYKP